MEKEINTVKLTRYVREDYKWEWQTKAYEAAELYSREYGFRIYNATRGGCLEVFERVNFDSLWS